MGELLKRSWQIAKKHKILWVFGFFLTGSGGLPAPDIIRSFGFPDFSKNIDSMSGAYFDKIPVVDPAVLIPLAFLAFITGMAFIVISIISEGAMVNGVTEAAIGGDAATFRLGDLFKKGASFFWVLLGVNILVWLPLAVIFFVLSVMLVVLLAGAIVAGNALAAVAGLAGFFLIGGPILLVAGILTGVINNFAKRGAVIEGTGVVASVKSAFRLFGSSKGKALGLYFVNLAILFVSGLVLGLLGITVILPFGLLDNFAGMDIYRAAGIFLILLPFFLALRVIGGIVSTVQSSFWTLGYLDIRNKMKEEMEAEAIAEEADFQ